jgi:nucleoside-diphosphate-sugar epimerase
MRIFVTGVSGYVGSAVIRDLLEGGHQITGLARSDESAVRLSTSGIEVHRGALEDLDSLREGAAASDGVIHLAFSNIGPNTDFAAAAQQDLDAVEAIGSVLEYSDRPFVITTGTLMLALLGRLGTENDVLDSSIPRVASENAAIAMAERGVRSSAIRLAPSVHGEGDVHGFIPSLIGIARAKGVSAYVGDGLNRWPGVHRLDAARLYRLAFEAAPAGSRLHGAGEEGVPFKDIAETIGRQLGLPSVSIGADEAGDHFGFLSMFVSFDNPTSNALTREQVGWQPTHLGLIEDLEQDHYFRNSSS